MHNNSYDLHWMKKLTDLNPKGTQYYLTKTVKADYNYVQ